MKLISRTMLGLGSAVLGGLLVFGAIQWNLLGRETNNVPAKIKVETAPVNREARGVTSYSPVIKKAAPSVVNIYSERTVRIPRMQMPFFFFGEPFGQEFGQQPNPRNRGHGEMQTRKERSLGSGVIVSPEGYIITANHVIADADEDGVKVQLGGSGKEYQARVIGKDPQTDIAVLKIEAENLQAITLADSEKLEVGDVVLAIGNPFGLSQSVTMGIVSATGRTALGIIRDGGGRGYENFIQTDAPINQGNSGGALIDAEGRLVGINTAIFSPSGGNAGIGFAVPVNMARSVMEGLITSGKVTRGYLGISLQEITPELAEDFELPDSSGALVNRVFPNTPAAKTGIQTGDVVREVDGRKIEDSAQLRLMIAQMAPGSKVTLKILRAEGRSKPKERTVTVTLGTLPTERSIASNMQSGDTELESSSEFDGLDGVVVADLDSSVRRELQIPENVQGALVTDVDPQSNAAAAQLRRGDVILEIDRKPVKNASEAVEASENANGKRVRLRVWRDDATLFMSVDNTKRK